MNKDLTSLTVGQDLESKQCEKCGATIRKYVKENFNKEKMESHWTEDPGTTDTKAHYRRIIKNGSQIFECTKSGSQIGKGSQITLNEDEQRSKELVMTCLQSCLSELAVIKGIVQDLQASNNVDLR